MHTTVQSFRLAHMSPLIWMLTLALLAVPVVFFSTAMVGGHLLTVPALCVVVLYVWVWLRFRPTRFVVYPDRLEVRWPLKRRSIPRKDIAAVRLIDKRALHSVTGWGMRVGAGGLWGGFGWLWTQRRGIVQIYISRTDGFVWIERVGDRPWLITPAQPAAFVRALSSASKNEGLAR
jgi:Bacterial PH domain